jgi:P4 family phage/plasmid primase-like protien
MSGWRSAARVEAEFDSLKKAVQWYRSHRFAVTRIVAGHKRPMTPGWSKRSSELADFQPGDQVGILSGALSSRPLSFEEREATGYLVTVDLDSPQALVNADRFLPPTGMVSGRPGKPKSHRFYLVVNVPEELAASESVAGGIGGPCIFHHGGLDILGTGGQTVEPPSTWADDTGRTEQRVWYDLQGQAIEWPGDPAVVDCRTLYAAVESLIRSYGGRVSGQKRGPRGIRLDQMRDCVEDLPAEEVRVARARAYLARVDGAVDGEQGHNTTYRAACVVVRDFAVEYQDAWPLLLEYNKRCLPPWSLKELEHKLDDADNYPDPRGWKLLDRLPDEPDLHQICPRERQTDPHRLARDFQAQSGVWRFWRDEWWHWRESHYVRVPDGDFDARLIRSIEARFLADWQEADQRTRQECEEERKQLPPDAKQPTTVRPVKTAVTRAIVGNARLALSGLTLLDSSVDAPAWINPLTGLAVQRSYLAVRNGLLDVEAALAGKTDVLLSHSPSWFSPICLPYGYDVQADCPRWKQALDRCLGGDGERIALLQEWFGYSLVPDTTQQKFLMLYGEGNNGKSVVCAALTALLGEANVSQVALENFANRFALAQTLGKLANIASEVGELDKAAEGTLKAFTSGDRMSFDRKGKSLLDAAPSARLVLATNNRPRFSDRSNGVWRRLLLVPFDVVISPDEQVAGMDKPPWWIDSGELSGMLNWALEGLKRLRANRHFTQPAACVKVLEEYRTEVNPARAFLLAHCEKGEDSRIGKARLYRLYANWCEKNGHRNPLSAMLFGKEVNRIFPEVKNGKLQSTFGEGRVDAYLGLTCTFQSE